MVRSALAAALVFAVLASPARAGIFLPDGLGSIVKDAKTIAAFEVEKVDRDKGLIVFKKSAELKGKHPVDQLRLHYGVLGLGLKSHWKLILDWAEPGKELVLFHNGVVGLAYLGPPHYWVGIDSVQGSDLTWSLSGGVRYFGYAYGGGVTELRTYVADMLQGKEVVVPALARTFFVFHQLFRDNEALLRLPVWQVRAGLDVREVLAEQPAHTQGRLVVGRGSGQIEKVPALVKALQEGDAAYRRQSAGDLAWIGQAALEAIPALTEALQDKDGHIRLAAAIALQSIDPDLPAVHAALRQGLKHADAAVRSAAIVGLWSFDAEVPQSFSSLVEAQRDADDGVRKQATRALGQLLWIRPLGKNTTVEELAAVLKSVDPDCRATAAFVLNLFTEPQAIRAVPALVEALRDPEVLVRPDAAATLAKIDPDHPALIPALRDMLNNEQLKQFKFPYASRREIALQTLKSLQSRSK